MLFRSVDNDFLVEFRLNGLCLLRRHKGVYDSAYFASAPLNSLYRSPASKIAAAGNQDILHKSPISAIYSLTMFAQHSTRAAYAR